MRTIDWEDDHIVIVDQTRLPQSFERRALRSVDELIDAIATLSVRGAPALGAAGALGVALAARTSPAAVVRADAERIRATRPTAVNLGWGVDAALAALPRGADAVRDVALALLEGDGAANRALGARGADYLCALLDGPVRIHTHCNAGALACVEWGTALGIVRSLHERGRVAEVFVDETRPLMQGARLTAWELAELGVPFRVVVDGAAASVIARGLVDVVIVGADRIAANGDVANKIGTYPLALAAARAGIPFVVAAPDSTVDVATPDGASIEIEERDGEEVYAGGRGYNPAFDVTPADLVTAIVTDTRVILRGELP